MGGNNEYSFESLNLQVTSRLQLLVKRNDKDVHYFTTLVGYLRDEFLLVKTPNEESVPVYLREGEVLSVRVFSGTTICSFVSTVERVFVNQFPYIHLSFPTAIQGRTLRKNPRISVSIPARIAASSMEPATAANGTLLNLSVDGALIECEHKIPPEEKLLDFSFEVTTQAVSKPVPIKTKAIVRNVRQLSLNIGRGDVFHYGVQFKEMDPMQHLILQNMTYEVLIESPQKLT